MFTFLAINIVLAAAFLSAENLVVTIAGFVLTALGTQFFKGVAGLQGAGSVLLAIFASVVVAIVGILAASFFGGAGFSWDAIVKQSGQIFVLATLAYHVLRPGDSTAD